MYIPSAAQKLRLESKHVGFLIHSTKKKECKGLQWDQAKGAERQELWISSVTLHPDLRMSGNTFHSSQLKK